MQSPKDYLQQNWISSIWAPNSASDKDNDDTNDDLTNNSNITKPLNSTPETTNNSNQNNNNNHNNNNNDKRRDSDGDNVNENVYVMQKEDVEKLINLLHSSRCRIGGDKCPVLGAKCNVMKESYIHSKKCKELNCKEVNCNKKILRHFAECQWIECPDCSKVRTAVINPKRSRGVISFVH